MGSVVYVIKSKGIAESVPSSKIARGPNFLKRRQYNTSESIYNTALNDFKLFV